MIKRSSMDDHALRNVLMRLNHDDTISMCTACRSFSLTCRDPSFWRAKIETVYGIRDVGKMNSLAKSMDHKFYKLSLDRKCKWLERTFQEMNELKDRFKLNNYSIRSIENTLYQYHGFNVVFLVRVLLNMSLEHSMEIASFLHNAKMNSDSMDNGRRQVLKLLRKYVLISLQEQLYLSKFVPSNIRDIFMQYSITYGYSWFMDDRIECSRELTTLVKEQISIKQDDAHLLGIDIVDKIVDTGQIKLLYELVTRYDVYTNSTFVSVIDAFAAAGEYDTLFAWLMTPLPYIITDTTYGHKALGISLVARYSYEHMYNYCNDKVDKLIEMILDTYGKDAFHVLSDVSEDAYKYMYERYFCTAW